MGCSYYSDDCYGGLTVGQVVGIVLGYFVLFIILWKNYRSTNATHTLMAMKMEKVESDLARLESIHIVLEAMPQLMEQRLRGTNRCVCFRRENCCPYI